jgi:hypothetical protein
MWIYYIRRKPPTCFGQLLWPSSGRWCTKDTGVVVTRPPYLLKRTQRMNLVKRPTYPTWGIDIYSMRLRVYSRWNCGGCCMNHVISALVPVLFDSKSITAIDVRFVHSAKCPFYRASKFGRFITWTTCVCRVIPWQVPCWGTQGKGHPMYCALSSQRFLSLVVILVI